MAIAQIDITNTFFEKMQKINEIAAAVNGLEDGSTSVANTSLTGELFTLTSNSANVTVSNGTPEQDEVVYIDVTLSQDLEDSGEDHFASSNLVSLVFSAATSAYDAANTVSTDLAGTTADVANDVITTAAAYSKANTNATDISGANANMTSNAVTIISSFALSNTANAVSAVAVVDAANAHAKANTNITALATTRGESNTNTTAIATTRGESNTATTIASAALPIAGGTMTGALMEGVVTLSDGATVALDASLGNLFYLAAGGNRTILAPTNETTGQRIMIRHYASGANRTLSLTTGTGGFRFGADIPSLLVTSSGTMDYIGAVYNGTDDRWDVIAYVQGY